jgi:hypothetical protein
MKTLISYAAAFFACAALGTGAYAQATLQDPAKPAAQATKPANETAKPAAKAVKPAADSSKPAAETVKPAADAAKPAAEPAKIRHHARRRGGLFSNWCAYNCYAVSPCYHGGCLGEYGYSRYAYDQDIPFHYRWDRDATPSDNVLAKTYPVTGEWFMRMFERTY